MDADGQEPREAPSNVCAHQGHRQPGLGGWGMVSRPVRGCELGGVRFSGDPCSSRAVPPWKPLWEPAGTGQQSFAIGSEPRPFPGGLARAGQALLGAPALGPGRARGDIQMLPV